MISNAPKKKKWIAASIIATISTGLGSLSRYLFRLNHNEIIDRENLGVILTQIEEANIDTGALASILQEAPPVGFVFIVSLAGIAITVWLYHKILGYLCKQNKNPNHSSEPT